MIKIGSRIKVQGGTMWALNGKTGTVAQIRVMDPKIFSLPGPAYEVKLDDMSCGLIPFTLCELKEIDA